MQMPLWAALIVIGAPIASVVAGVFLAISAHIHDKKNGLTDPW